jgi:hypothetical protein
MTPSYALTVASERNARFSPLMTACRRWRSSRPSGGRRFPAAAGNIKNDDNGDRANDQLPLERAGQLRVDGRLRQPVRLIHVDFDTLERTPKLSAAWIREAARQNAVV